MAQESLQLTGLALPAVRLAGGYFSPRDKYDVAWGDLLLAILTPIGGRPMNRSFGSALHLALEEPNDPAIAQRAEYAIRDAASRWVPHVIVYAIQILRKSRDLMISISFGLTEDSQIMSRTFSVSASQFAVTGGA